MHACRTPESRVHLWLDVEDYAGRCRRRSLCRISRQRRVVSETNRDADQRRRQDQSAASFEISQDDRRHRRADGCHRDILAPVRRVVEALGSISDQTAPRRGPSRKADISHLEEPRAGPSAIVRLAGRWSTDAGGARYPLGHDPNDSMIRIAPSFPELPDVEQAAEGVVVSVLLAAAEARMSR